MQLNCWQTKVSKFNFCNFSCKILSSSSPLFFIAIQPESKRILETRQRLIVSLTQNHKGLINEQSRNGVRLSGRFVAFYIVSTRVDHGKRHTARKYWLATSFTPQFYPLCRSLLLGLQRQFNHITRSHSILDDIANGQLLFLFSIVPSDHTKDRRAEIMTEHLDETCSFEFFFFIFSLLCESHTIEI